MVTVRTGNKSTGTPLLAHISVEGITHSIKSGADFGNFYRPLAPGKWTVTASLPGHGNSSVPITIPEDGSGVVLEFQLAVLDSSGNPIDGLQVRAVKGSP